MRFYFAFFAALNAAIVPSALAFTTWSGKHCNGTEGITVPCDGMCHSFSPIHSFKTGADTGEHMVYTWYSAECPDIEFPFSYAEQHGQCTVPLIRRQAVTYGMLTWSNVSPSVCTFNKSSKTGGPSRFRGRIQNPKCGIQNLTSSIQNPTSSIQIFAGENLACKDVKGL
ncbi:hypothetical protein EXIGLDRAFT_788096 [Exidia glandulosa HHB12029]|uniref:Uncharacterized protein n=1 Tax=Exidia glandulosa HHB12029 TaxID=1314781 RepID=A0A165II32_EXIGL|nr:hypothetical protein EXIGLDRAFT_788096 [Exidia glandulosa HHB12029]